MPDADKIGKLSRRWSKMYRKICEGHFDNTSLANDAMNPLMKDIEGYGNYPIRLLKEVSIRLDDIRNNPLFLPTRNWNDEDHFIRNLGFTYMHKYRSNQRGMNIAIAAYKDVVHNFRNEGDVSGNSYEVLIRRYIRRIYDSNFAELVPFAGKNHIDVDWDINQRLNEIDNFVDKNIDSLASQIVRKGKIGRLRQPRSTPQRTVTIEDDVFALGNSR